MATANVSSAAFNRHHILSESLPLIDLRLLSQSELLSLSSSSSLNNHRQNEADVATLKIDRSVFNESAGSRKQTFSKLRLAPRNNSHFSPSPASSIRALKTFEFSQDEENPQIICLLKSLFGSNSTTVEKDDVYRPNLVSEDNLIHVPVTYNDSYEALQNFVAADVSGEAKKHAIASAVADPGTKRKRGRPRKNSISLDNKVNVNEEERKVVAVEEENVITGLKRKRDKLQPNSSNLDVNIINANENEERQAIVTEVETGVKVESRSASTEDWYGEELRRRTIGMQTEAELLGFLEGLQGEWASKRKKRRIVDATVLGDALPNGWKLIVCNKRRAGYFWLDCTGYISPNGLQFTSCKEVSSFLLSEELQDVSQSSFSGAGGNIQSTSIMSCGNAADPTLKDDKKGDVVLPCPVLPVTKPVELENQATNLTTATPGLVQRMGQYKCHKCTMAFEEPDGLLQHLLSSHQRPSKKLRQDSSMNEQVIIKHGKYECQFCQKTFEGRHSYNGHLGNHIKDYFKRIEGSGGAMSIQSGTFIGLHSNVLEMQKSNVLDLGSDAIPSGIKTNVETTSAVPCREVKENSIVESHSGQQDIVYGAINDKSGKINEILDVTAVENNVCSGAEVVLENIENSSVRKSSKGTTVFEHTFGRMNNTGSQEDGSQNSVLAAVERDQTCAAGNNEDQAIMNSIDKHDLGRDSGSGLLALNSKDKVFGGEDINDRIPCSTVNGMKLDGRDFFWEEKLETGFGKYCSSQKDVAANIKEQRSSEGCLFVPSGSEQRYGSVNNVDGLSTSITEMTHEQGSKGALSSSVEKSCFWSNNQVSNSNQVSSSTVAQSRFGELDKSRDNVQTFGFRNNRTPTFEDTVTSFEPESSLGSCSGIPSWNEQACLAENDASGTRRCTRKKYWQEKESGSSQLTLFGGRQSLGFENDIIKVSNCATGLPNHDEVQRSKNSDCSKDADLVTGCGTNIDLERSANYFLLGPSSNELTFPIKDKEVLRGTSKNLVQGRNYERQSFSGQKLNNENNMNMFPFITMDQCKNKEVKSSSDGEPRLVFHHSRREQEDGIVKNTTEVNFLKASSRLISGNQHNNETGLHRSTLDEQKRASIESLFGLSSSEPLMGVQNNSNMVLTGKAQEKPRLEDLYPSKNQSVIGFSSHTQGSENVKSDFIWRTDEENDLLSSFADTSLQLVHSSGCFPPFDVMSDKGESDLFSEKFSGISGFEGLRSGSMENMEYNFMTSHSDESKVFSYGADLGQGLDSSVWLEKEAMPLLPKMTSRRHVRTFCVWCRNEFRYEALESEAQLGSLGFTCAACKAKFPGHFSLF